MELLKHTPQLEQHCSIIYKYMYVCIYEEFTMEFNEDTNIKRIAKEHSCTESFLINRNVIGKLNNKWDPVE